MKTFILRIVRPGETTAEDDDHWAGPSDLVLLAADEDTEEEELVDRKSYESFADAHADLIELVSGMRKKDG